MGLKFVVCRGLKRCWNGRSPEWLGTVSGAWTYLSPWFLGYARPARTNASIIGIIVLIASLWAEATEGAIQHSHQPV